jgi:membrane-associated protein
MESAWEFIKDLFNPESIVRLGLPLLLFVIFAETGLLVGFFLPGDSLVFLSGVICATEQEHLGIGIVGLILSMSGAAILGNVTGYWFGRKVGERLYKREDSFLFKRRHLIATQAFYEKYGGITIMLGRFLPVIRTFAPVLAGVIQVNFQKFMLYNIAGAIAWIGSFCGIGYFLGKRYPWIKDYLGWIVIGLIVITAVPVVVTYVRERKKRKTEQ